MPRVRKWMKPKQNLLFKGEWGICNYNCDCHTETSIQAMEEEKRKEENEQQIHMGLIFQVADVKKSLVSVKRITEKGTHVCFGPGEKDNYIENRKTGDKIILRQIVKGSYLVDVAFTGGRKTEITVDSGAEENVCRWEWGEEFGINQATKRLVFRGANGAWIGHYGERKMFVYSPL